MKICHEINKFKLTQRIEFHPDYATTMMLLSVSDLQLDANLQSTRQNVSYQILRDLSEKAEGAVKGQAVSEKSLRLIAHPESHD